MEGFSDDEKFEVDQILGQRKRKGVVEYLVRWKGTEESDSTWEPAKTIAADCAKAVQNFVQGQKAQKSRSKSKTRSTSRSRSRSSSRSRKAAETRAGKSSRSRSRGRQEKKKATPATPPSDQKVDESNVRRSQRQKAAKVVSEGEKEEKEVQEVKVVTETVTKVQTVMSAPSKPTTEEGQEDTPPRSLRSTTLEQRKKLEVQRVHNDQRPVREDDVKPRSPIWKVADYIVIVMFVISVIAAIFLFVEKFFDLENFKQQAFPNFGVLKDRLQGASQRVVEFGQTVLGYVSNAWLYLIEQIKSPETVQKATAK